MARPQPLPLLQQRKRGSWDAYVLLGSQIASKDKDFRYMATSDLLNELQKDTFKADGDLERKLCQVVLTQLEDTSGDISGLAVKW